MTTSAENPTFPIRMPEGRLPMHGVGAINTRVSKEDAAQTASKINNRENLDNIFFGNRVLGRTSVGGANITFHDPTGPYTPRGVMISAYEDLERLSENTEEIYDYSRDAQVGYWGLVVAGLDVLGEMTDGEGVITAYVENTISTVTSDSHRTSRSLSAPHGHFVEIDPKLFHPTTMTIKELDIEKGVLARHELVRKYTQRVAKDMLIEQVLAPDFEVREVPPLGYSFSFSGDTDVARITDTLRAHFWSSSRVGYRYLNAARQAGIDTRDIIPPPSFGLYMFRNNGNLDVIISPEFYSAAGVMERANIFLDRSPEHPKIFEDEEALSFRKEFVEKTLQRALDIGSQESQQ